jgi:predicted nucleic acid-binding protein
MDYLVDTGVLVRLTEPSDPLHPVIAAVLEELWKSEARLVVSMQNIAEFWAVCTRPKESRGGLGLSIEQVDRRLRFLEAIITVLPDPPTLYDSWRQIILEHRVTGVQVHDARIAAFIAMQHIEHLLTLNPRDFHRYPWVKLIVPGDLPVQQMTSNPTAPGIEDSSS